MEAAAYAAGAGAGAGLGLLGALWLGAGAALRTWNRPRARGYGRHMGQRPAVAVVLPVKGHHAHSEANWMNQLAMDYEGGDVQYLFVLEARADPAYGQLRQLVETLRANSCLTPRQRVELVVAGRATTCSQKLHNMLAGLAQASPAAEYVLFLDDDIKVHRNLLQNLVGEFQSDRRLFLATGYPFDVLPPGSSVWAYAAIAWHLLLGPFFAFHRTMFVWGGCMMFRRKDLAEGRGLPIACPSTAILLQPLRGDWSFARFWNYLHRQLFVLDTYASPHNRRTNHTGLAVFVAVPCLLGFGVLAALANILRFRLLAVYSRADHGDLVAPYRRSLAVAAVGAAAFCCLHFYMQSVKRNCNVLLGGRPDGGGKHTFEWGKLVAGFCCCVGLCPAVGLLALFVDEIDWAGIVYRKGGGRIVGIQHPGKRALATSPSERKLAQ